MKKSELDLLMRVVTAVRELGKYDDFSVFLECAYCYPNGASEIYLNRKKVYDALAALDEEIWAARKKRK